MKTLRSAATMAAASLLCASGLYRPAFAAAAAAGGGDTGLDEIVVTAEKRDSTVQATAISMTAISGDQLEAQGIKTVEDIAAKVPGISIRSAGPGQTEYEMRGLSAGGGTAATVGFYLDETPLSANAVALNGRTVIDPDLFDLNHVEVLRGPQGTLYGSGSMGGTIKLVTNQPALGKWDAATDTYVSDTSHGSGNGGGSLMLNIPVGDVAALRLVGTAKYISGWINRVYGVPGEFPAPTNPPSALYPGCVYYCTRGDVSDMPVGGVVKGSNLERFESARATFLVKPSDALSITAAAMYQVIRADGYNNYQEQPGGLAIYQPYDQPEPYRDYFRLTSLKIEYLFDAATLTSATSYWTRGVLQSTDATEALQNINNLTHIVNGVAVPNFIDSLYQEYDPTSQFSEELRLTSSGTGRLDWVGGLYFAKLDSGYITFNQDPGFATTLSCGLASAANPVAGYCPVGSTYNPNSTYRYPNPALPQYPSGQAANPNGVVFNDNNPNTLKQEAIFGEVNYKFREDLRLTGGLRYFHYTIDNFADQAGLGTASGNQDATILSQSASGSAVLPKINLSYEPTADLTVYSTIAKGSRPGGFNLPIPLPSAEVLAGNPNSYNCAPPASGAAGVYVTSQPSFSPDSVWSFEVGEKARLDDRRITVNADVYYIKWQNIQQVLSLTCGYPYNTNAGNAKSYGPEAEISAVIVSGLTFDLSGAYTQAYISDPTAAAIGSGISPGTRVLNVPKYTAVAGLNYAAPVAAGLHGMFHVGSSLVGPTADQAAVRQTLPSYNLMDARTGVAGDHWAAYIFGTNLTNKVAALTINNTVFAWQTYAITRVSTNQPRTIGLDFQYKF